MCLERPELFWQLRIADVIPVEIDDAKTHSVLHFAFAEIVQERPPMFVSFEIFGVAFGEKNVPGVAAVHHPLRHIKTGTGKIGLTIHIYHTADRTAVRSHSKLYLRVFFESASDFERAFHWFFGALVKYQRHPVTGWDLDQSGPGFGVLKLLGSANGLSQVINRRALIVNRKLRVANDVDEQDMGDLELDLFFDLGGHSMTPLAIVREQSFHCYSIDRERRRQGRGDSPNRPRAIEVNPLASKA